MADASQQRVKFTVEFHLLAVGVGASGGALCDFDDLWDDGQWNIQRKWRQAKEWALEEGKTGLFIRTRKGLVVHTLILNADFFLALALLD